MDRAFSIIEIKALDEDKRIIKGIASTPNLDLVGDIMEMKGAQYKLPMPLLWQHNPANPIGHVTKAKITSKGIEIEAEIAKIDEPGELKDFIDKAWQSLKHKLVQGLSIGFKSLEHAFIEDAKGFAVRHIKWLWVELSAVTIPANMETTITSVKALSTKQLTALGLNTAKPVRLIPPSALGKKTLGPKEPTEMKTIAEQIAALENTRNTKALRMSEVASPSQEAGETMSAEAAEEFDTLTKEIDNIDADLKRLKILEGIQAKGAKAIAPTGKTIETVEEGETARSPLQNVVLDQKLAPGIRMARVVRCMAHSFKQVSKGTFVSPIDVAKDWYKTDPVIANFLKANVAAGTTLSGNWAEGLVGSETKIIADFVEYLRPMTILGKFGTGGVPALHTIPFRVALVSELGGGEGYWVGEGKAKPLTSFDYSRTNLSPLKVANICVLTDDLVRDSSPSAETLVRNSLVNALRARLDMDFINPDKAAVANVSPAGILNGVAGIPSSGNDADAIRADIGTLFGAFIDANNAPTNGVWIMSARTALRVSLMMNPLGQPEFPGINMNGGVLAGLPVITSEFVTPNTSGDFIALVNASDVYLADDGGFNVDMSREASLEMSDAPAHNSGTPTAAQMVSMFQTNSVAIRAERTINWSRRRNEGVAWLSNVNWGGQIT